MVGPSISDDDRRSLSMRLRAGFVGLVGISGALVAIQAGAGVAGIAAATAGGLLVGVALVWYLMRIAPWDATGDDRTSRRRDR